MHTLLDMKSSWNRRNVLKAVGSTNALLAAGVGSAAAKPPSEGETIADLVVGDPRFSTLEAAVKKAGLVETLDGNRQLTVFAPTNEGFENAGITSLPPEDELSDILTYHVTPGRRGSESVTTSDELPTLNGELIQVDGTELNGGQANIITDNPGETFDIEASNGIIHAIDGVLLP